MKRKFGWLGISLAAAAILLVSCKDKEPEETPREAFQAYLADWKIQNYAGMYARLTPELKAKMTEEQFAERYRKIYDGIGEENLALEAIPPATASAESDPAASPGETELGFRLAMDTSAGPIRFEHEAKLVQVEEEQRKRWKVAWEPSLIFPGMKDGDKVRVTSSRGERGEIVDRNGNGLAVNGTALQLGLVPGKMSENSDADLAKLAGLLGIDAADIRKKLGASWVKPDLFVPIAIVPDGDVDRYTDIPGVTFQKKKVRVYPYAEAATHLTGYLGEVTAEQLDRLKEKGYGAGDVVGQAGLEQVFEDRLRGTQGTKIAITDESGQEKSVLAEVPAKPGETIRLTIDADLQRTVYGELKDEKANAAAIDPKTGAVLALVSTPAYDPNAFARGVTPQQYKAWSEDPRQPFLNRFTKTYAPGSSFKVMTAAIGLDSKTLDPNEAKTIQGLTWTKDASWGEYYVKRVHDVNPVNLQNALVYSDNIYFAQAALTVGKSAYVTDAAKFGMGEALPLPYPFKKSQLFNKDMNTEIQLADSGYGQGEVLMTSLHVALVYSALVDGGNIVYPRMTEEDGGSAPAYWREGAMTPETAELLKQDLIKAVSDPHGVGHGAAVPGAAIAGKTGTAELKLTKGGEGTENGWFVGFNANDPKLLLAVMVEDVKGRGGSGFVTPKVKRIFQQSLKTGS
ncbi:penicillin-binding transpeptidase domain-containing protein [Cohnella zeiphila]|uniref:Penicillin-binding transpeptidase domain-containing protein n=1 Tax=Cohnella zeiphila TaxID=2761120 RepID=A0A7X0VUG3_9BACL|nr:penicillin-binding transpeptidase domain-containing protein [Cohnella zeiphila]MBB6730390.1 penicillin-binding transpeptidase domain-containing protein [Cohnella zeiphila]